MDRFVLDGVRVLDISQYIAGPSCCRMLADMGARVVRIDSPGGTPVPVGATYDVGKRSIVLDLKQPRGLQVARALALQADVLVQSYRPGALNEIGLGYESLTKQHQRLIYASISGFGEHGDLAHRRAFGANIQAEAGLIWVMQQAQGNSTPFSAGFPVADIVTGLHTCVAILTALYDREQTGRGKFIDMSLMDCQLAVLNELARAPLAGQPAEEWRPTPHGLLHTRDGRYLTYNLLYDPAAPSAGYFYRIARALGWHDPVPPESAAEAEALVERWVGERSVAEVARAFEEAGLAYGVVKTMHEALAQPLYEERGMIVALENGASGASVRVVNSPWRFSDAVVRPGLPAPSPGADTVTVLQSLGYDEAAITDLLRSRAAISSA